MPTFNGTPVTTSTEYCTLAELRAKLAFGASNTASNTQLTQIIEASTPWIDRYCGRRFYGSADTRYYTAEDGYEVYIDDLTSITSLATDEDSDGTFETTWNATDYLLRPYNAREDDKPYTRIESTPNGTQEFPTLRKAVRVVGVFGYVPTTGACPDPVHDAALLLCERIYKRKDAPLGVMGGNMQLGQEPVRITSMSADPDIRDLLAPYRSARAIGAY